MKWRDLTPEQLLIASQEVRITADYHSLDPEEDQETDRSIILRAVARRLEREANRREKQAASDPVDPSEVVP
jgi:hypothetical protein